MYKQCPLCQSNKITSDLFYKEDVFVSVARLLSTREVDTWSSAISLSQCKQCGLLFNNKFDSDKICEAYQSDEYVLKKIQNGQMSNNLRNIKETLMKYIKTDSTVLEVGSGDGILALSLAKLAKQVVTVDPSVESVHPSCNCNNVIHLNSYFSKSDLQCEGYEKFDVIIARHILEHIDKPDIFLSDLISLVKEDGFLYLEVPNVEEIIGSNRFYDIFHDHFSYYQSSVIVSYLRRSNLRLIEKITVFNKQHMGLLFKKTFYDSQRDEEINRRYLYHDSDFVGFYKSIGSLNNLLDGLSGYALWGAGAHGNSLLNYLNPENIKKIELCFDKDKKKEKKFLLNGKIEVRWPSKELVLAAETIIIASSLYEEEIAQEIKLIGFKGKIIKTAKKIEMINLK